MQEQIIQWGFGIREVWIPQDHMDKTHDVCVVSYVIQLDRRRYIHSFEFYLAK